MEEDFGDLLTFFDNDSDDENADSADEILGMLDDGKSHDNNATDENENDDDTKDKIAALQAQIELLKSKKGGSKVKSSSKPKTLTEVCEEGKCKHGKLVKDCFFCSSKPLTENISDKRQSIEEDISKRIKKEKKTETKLPKDDDSTTDIFAILPEFKGENTVDLSKKRRLAHDNDSKSNKDREIPRKKLKVEEEKSKPVKTNNVTVTCNRSVNSGNAHCFAGVEVSNPVISSAIFDQRTKDRRLIKISKIETTLKGNDIEGDWVTVGVVVRKVTQKKSSSGKNFSVWHLSDLCLGTENNVLALFLFGSSYDEHWKIQVGRVIAILNPEINKQDDQQISIKIDNAKRLMELGDAKFLGGCKGHRKSDGKPCTMYINKKYGEYCEYHVQAAFKKAKSGRMDLQSGGHAPKNKGKLLKNLKKDISGGEFYYGGKTVTLHDEKLTSKVANKNNETKSTGLKSFLNYKTRMQAALEYNTAKQKRELEEPTTKDISATNFLKLNKNELLNKGKGATKSSDNLSKILEKQEKRTTTDKHTLVKNSSNSGLKMSIIDPTSKSNVQKPRLGRGLKSDDQLDFFFSNDDFCYEKHTGENPLINDVATFKKVISKDLKTEVENKHIPIRSIKAKQHAISMVKYKGPIELEDPNIDIVKNSSKLKNVEKVLKNCERNCEKEEGKEKKKKKGSLGGVLGHIDINSDDGKKLLQKTSKHVGAVKLAESEREEKYFNSLERKEGMAEKMTTTFQIKVSGVACRECHYLAESQSEMCKKLNHAIAKIPNIVKRFFACKSCKTRCCSYNKPLPKNPCTRCGESNFEKTSMGVERKGPLIGSETLQVADSEKGLLYS